MHAEAKEPIALGGAAKRAADGCGGRDGEEGAGADADLRAGVDAVG